MWTNPGAVQRASRTAEKGLAKAQKDCESEVEAARNLSTWAGHH